MKKVMLVILMFLLLVPTLPAFAADDNMPDSDEQGPDVQKPGGFTPCLYSFIYGPRAAYEFNEGRKIRTSEKFCLIFPFAPIVKMIDAYDAYKGKTMSEVVVEEDLDKDAEK
ncbi:MAG: hypothetical protein HZA77_15290 [Candidatus Schekmanbacteria bacterium]|nr:hypothetical protein [Candidatus Schekmanbacteria bacterium]